jgi:hypothetical protein
MPQDKLVIRVGGFVITKYNLVVPAKLSYVTDVGGIPSHNGLRHLASGHINVVTHARADICLKFKAMVP